MYVCIYVCVLSTFSNISSETTGPIEVKLHMESPWEGGTKICSNGPGHMTKMAAMPIYGQDRDQDSLLVKRRNDNHSPGPVIRDLVPSSHQRSELSNTILCIFSG